MVSYSSSVPASPVRQNPPSRLEQLLQIAQGGGTDSEKRAALRNMQLQMEGERMNELFARIPQTKPEAPADEESANEDGDTVQISQEAKTQFEQSEAEQEYISSQASQKASPETASSAAADQPPFGTN